jgi:hypothetical protein
LHKIAEILYKANEAKAGAEQAAGASAGAGPSGGTGSTGAPQDKKPGDVIDAEYVDVDETKRPN